MAVSNASTSLDVVSYINDDGIDQLRASFGALPNGFGGVANPAEIRELFPSDYAMYMGDDIRVPAVAGSRFTQNILSWMPKNVGIISPRSQGMMMIIQGPVATQEHSSPLVETLPIGSISHEEARRVGRTISGADPGQRTIDLVIKTVLLAQRREASRERRERSKNDTTTEL